MVKERSSKQTSLHWPGWIWVVGHFLLFGYFLAAFIAMLINDALFNWPVWGIITYSLLFFCYAPLCLVSALFMLINRRIGWFLAFATLGASTLYFVLFVSGAMLTGMLTWFTIMPYALVINVGWLVYFILARRRYGIGSKREV